LHSSAITLFLSSCLLAQGGRQARGLPKKRQRLSLRERRVLGVLKD
jgi:hypothetical protein